MSAAHASYRKSLRLDEYADESWFGRLDARAKLVGIFSFVVASAVLTNLELVLISLAMAILLAAACLIPPIHLAKMYLVALPFMLAASVSVFLFGGWERGVAMWARTSACVLSLFVLSAGTESFDLFSGLRRLHVPAIVTTLLMLTQRYILVLSEELSRMTMARRARGFRGGRSLLDSHGLRVISFTAGMVLVRSLKRADRIYEGLKGKGFSKDMRPWRISRFAMAEVAFLACLLFEAGVLLSAQSGVVP
jgi:cobalt/nickel transport system permease protein